MKNIYLIGMPGCGKTTIGKSVAKNLNFEFKDLDDYIVSLTKRTIDDMFSEGEAVFRTAETFALNQIAKEENLIVATGGGVIVTDENIAVMKKSGLVIFINSEVETILKNSSLEGRPLLKDKNKIYELYQNRIKLYKKAAMYIVDNNGSIEDVVKQIQEIIKAAK